MTIRGADYYGAFGTALVVPELSSLATSTPFPDDSCFRKDSNRTKQNYAKSGTQNEKPIQNGECPAKNENGLAPKFPQSRETQR